MARKFGTFKGVFVPSTEAILGTVLFLLLPTLTADVGLFPIVVVILLAHTVTIATSFSIADCATNLNSIGGGGMYALSKRSLGKALGGSIGFQLYLAQAASIGFYAIGFAEPLQPIVGKLMNQWQILPFMAEKELLFQKQILATIFFVIFFIIVMVGADFTLKIQTLILFVLSGSILVIFLSPFLGLQFNNADVFVSELERINFFGNRELSVSIFFLTFTQFFPAVTGIDAGVGMSGDLENPKRSLVRGTFSAIFVTLIIYLIAGYIFSLMDKNLLIKGYDGLSPVGLLLTDLLGLEAGFPLNLAGVMVLLGILFATGSSALSVFMTAPRTMQSLARDRIIPRQLYFLQKDFFSNGNEPRSATLLTFFVGISIIWMGNINVAATIVGILFLVVYGWVNGSAFLERISRNPTFRPTSRGHWTISLYGFVAAILAITLFSWKVGLLIFFSQYILFTLILKYKAKGKMEGVWWGVLFFILTSGLRALRRVVQGTKNWRPILSAIAFSGKEHNPKNIAYLANVIASYQGLVHLNIIGSEKEIAQVGSWHDYQVPTGTIITANNTDTVLDIVQFVQMGGVRSNTILLEFDKSLDTIQVMKMGLSLNKNILLLKNGERFYKHEYVDIWWRGEKNGNLMVLLAYIINRSQKAAKGWSANKERIRLIRKLDKEENHEQAKKQAYTEMRQLLDKARLSGEVFILPYADEPFQDTLYRISHDVDLLMLGLPGNFVEEDRKNIFKLDEYFFDKEILKYSDLPAILFVRSSHVMELIED